MQIALYRRLPSSPGVYLMKDAAGRILYAGKAGNLKRRVASYFSRLHQDSGGQARDHEYRIEKLVREIRKIDYKKTATALEALILEAELIKRYQPSYNVREKDDKSFLYVEITREPFPRVLLVRGRERLAPHRARSGAGFGPFVAAMQIREALRIIRKIFPYNTHQLATRDRRQETRATRPCFEYEIGMCPGTCIGAVSRAEYAKTIRHIRLLFRGRGEVLRRALRREMREASRRLEFERAAAFKRQLFALQHVQDIALISDMGQETWDKRHGLRIEGYDISNISGTSAVGSMVVFVNGKPDKNEYRKFKIRTITQSDDVGMLKEVVRRRLRHPEWPLPALMLIDGGKPQANAVRAVLEEAGVRIPVVGIAKGPTRKKNEFVGAIPAGVDPTTLIRVRDEAHRFAVRYHRALRGRSLF